MDRRVVALTHGRNGEGGNARRRQLVSCGGFIRSADFCGERFRGKWFLGNCVDLTTPSGNRAGEVTETNRHEVRRDADQRGQVRPVHFGMTTSEPRGGSPALLFDEPDRLRRRARGEHRVASRRRMACVTFSSIGSSSTSRASRCRRPVLFPGTLTLFRSCAMPFPRAEYPRDRLPTRSSRKALRPRQ